MAAPATVGCEGGTCARDDTCWLRKCAKHTAEDLIVARRWRADYLRTERYDPERINFDTDIGKAEGLL